MSDLIDFHDLLIVKTIYSLQFAKFLSDYKVLRYYKNAYSRCC